MSRAHDTLLALGYVNGWDVAKAARAAGVEPTGLFLVYYPGHKWALAKWQVILIGGKSDPNNQWQDRGNKTFVVFQRRERENERRNAESWASNEYGITEWATIPGLPGYVFPKVTADWVKAQVKAYKQQA